MFLPTPDFARSPAPGILARLPAPGIFAPSPAQGVSVRTPARGLSALVVGLALWASTGCASLTPPFDAMKTSPMTVYRLQNYEPPPPPAASAPSALTLPPQIQQWIQAGASLLPPGLLPPGLLPGASAPPAPAPTDAPRFHGFRILDYQPVADAAVKSDIVDVFGTKSDFQSATTSCMFAEFGFAIAQPNGPTPADILVSLSCEQVQVFNFTWPYAQAGLTPDASKKIAGIVQKVFQGR